MAKRSATTKHRFVPLDARTARGALTKGEELEISRGLVPEKTVDQLKTQHERLAERADTVKRPEDRIPLQLHSAGLVDDEGKPPLHEAFLRMLCGDGPTTDKERRTALILAELERLRPVLWAVMAQHYTHKRTEAEIAAELFLSQQTVSRMLIAGTKWVFSRYRELYEHVD